MVNQPRVAYVSDERQLPQDRQNSELSLMHCCGSEGNQDSIRYFIPVPNIKTTFDRFLSEELKHYLIG